MAQLPKIIVNSVTSMKQKREREREREREKFIRHVNKTMTSINNIKWPAAGEA